MIEVTILNYLNSVEGLAPTKMEVPPTPPTRFYVLDKTGGDLDDHIKHSTFAVQSYAPTKYEAAQMNESVKEAMLNGLLALDDIVDVDLNSDYDYTDTQENRYRYQAVFDVTHY